MRPRQSEKRLIRRRKRHKEEIELKDMKICRYCGGVIRLVPASSIYGESAERLGMKEEWLYRYAVRHEATSTLSPYEFWKRCETEAESELLPVPITLHEVVEIDDGLKPTFFYKTTSGFKIAYGFKPAAAHK